MLHEEPGALVLRLVLAPHDFGRVRVLLQLGGERLVRERIELLDADDRDVGVLALVALLDQVVVDLARAGDHALDLVGVDVGAVLRPITVWNSPLVKSDSGEVASLLRAAATSAS